MRRARPSAWTAAMPGGGLAFMRSTSSSSSTGTAAAADAGASPREEELRAALGSDEVLPNNVTLLMTRRQRGEDSEGEQEDGEEE